MDKLFGIDIIWVYAIIGIPIIILIWHFFGRRRCPKCKSTKCTLIDSKELDRWQGTKEVKEEIGKDKNGVMQYRKKIVPTTFVKIERTYKCQDCAHIWDEVNKEEKQ